MKFLSQLLEMQRLEETVTFDVSEFIEDDPDFPKGLFTGQKWWRKELKKCPFCDNGKEHYRAWKDADGKEHPAYSVDCDYCDGKGEKDEHVSDAPEMNLSNANAMALLDYLGQDTSGPEGLVGSIPPKDLPELRRKLIKMKNGGADDLVTPWKDEPGKMRRGHDEHGNPSIGRGPRVMGGERTPEQVIAYVDRLLALIDFAQKNDAHLTWG